MNTGTTSEHAGRANAGGPSVISAVERLLVASEGVIAKRIDLALLEGHELLARVLLIGALGSSVILLVTGALFALIAALVLAIMPEATRAAHLAVFGGIDVVVAVAIALPLSRTTKGLLLISEKLTRSATHLHSATAASNQREESHHNG